jgi:hypothetical protein
VLAPPTQAPTPTPTSTPTATPSPTPSGSPTASPTALAATQEPRPEATQAPAVVVEETAGENARPELLQNIPRFSDIVTSPGVVSTNLGLAIGTVLVLLATAAIFNTTLEENDHLIRGWLEKISSVFAGPVSGFHILGDTLSHAPWMRIFVGPLVVIVLAGLLYALEEPSFGFNEASVILTLSFIVTFVVLTYVWDGGQLMVTNAYKLPGTIRIFPAGLVIAILCVAATRIQGFQPGLVFGFVAAHALTAEVVMTPKQKGMQILWPSLALLAVCLIAWAALGPARDLAQDGDTMWAALPEAIAVGLFLAGIQSLFLMMIPIKFMDGHKLMSWNKLVWAAITVTSGFIFWHAMMNEEKEALNALSQTGAATFAILIVGSLGIALATYAFFWWRTRGDPMHA